MILAFRVGVAVATIVRPRGIVTVEKNAVAEDADDVVGDWLGFVAGWSGIGGDDHGVMLVVGTVFATAGLALALR